MKESLEKVFLKWFIVLPCSIPVLILITPIRWVFDFFTIYNPDLFRTKNNPSIHSENVRKIQKQIRTWNENGRVNKLCTARPTWQTLSLRNLNKTKFTRINVDLEDIIQIDTEKMVLKVEPGMKMGTLTHKLLKDSWTIPVIPEFESLTVGGCINGTGIETSSHKFGLFATACLEYEIVLADGSCVTCSKTENSDLFFAIPWSHGTLGFLTSATIPIYPISKYVKLEYIPTNSIEEAKNLLGSGDNLDFIEGIMFDLNKIMVMYGSLVDTPEVDKVNRINRWYKPWFFKHVEYLATFGERSVEYIPIRDYYHRHQRAYFWEVETLLPFGNLAVIRILFGWIYPLNFQLIKLLLPQSYSTFFCGDNHVLQDFLIPFDKLESCLQLAHEEVQVYPIWLCPCKFFNVPGMAPPTGNKDEMYIDVGIYGDAPFKYGFNPRTKIRKFEKYAIENSGYQFLYADTFMSSAEFKKMFAMGQYDKVRVKYACDDAFPYVYDKISMSATS